MPTDVTGKDRKLARPYHGAYRIVALTPTNAEVKTVIDQSIFVVLDQLCRYYPNTSWTGCRKTHQQESGNQFYFQCSA